MPALPAAATTTTPVATAPTTWATRDLPVASARLLWSQSMPESSTAMPTPLPVNKAAVPALSGAALPVASCNRLALRWVDRLGRTNCTSLRAAMLATWAAGSMADMARTES